MLKPKFWNIERQCLQRDLNIDEVLNKNVASRNLCRRIAKSWYTNLKPDMREVWGPEVTGPRPSAVICVHEELEPEVADPRLVVKTGGVSSRVIQRMSSCTLCVGLEPRKLSCCNRAEGFVLAFAYCFSSSALRYSSASRSYTTCGMRYCSLCPVCHGYRKSGRVRSVAHIIWCWVVSLFASLLYDLQSQ